MKLNNYERQLLIDAGAIAADNYNYDGEYHNAEEISKLIVKILDEI